MAATPVWSSPYPFHCPSWTRSLRVTHELRGRQPQWLCSEFVPFLLLFDCQEAFHCCLVVTCINRINMISIQCHRVGEWWSGKPEFENVSDPAGVYIPVNVCQITWCKAGSDCMLTPLSFYSLVFDFFAWSDVTGFPISPSATRFLLFSSVRQKAPTFSQIVEVMDNMVWFWAIWVFRTCFRVIMYKKASYCWVSKVWEGSNTPRILPNFQRYVDIRYIVLGVSDRCRAVMALVWAQITMHCVW